MICRNGTRRRVGMPKRFAGPAGTFHVFHSGNGKAFVVVSDWFNWEGR